MVDILAYTTITAFLCECAKFGIFLGIDMCTSPEYWYNNETNEYSGSVDCRIDRGAYMSVASIAAYFISVVMTVGFAARPKKDDFTYEEASLPSWMASENDSSAKALAPSDKENKREMDRNSSVGGYAWSRSAPSTIPSQNGPEEDFALDEEPEAAARADQVEPIPVYPPKGPRRYDDCSTLTFDPGY